ncbi:MAG: hypothetical protein J6C38_02890 [Oscillospiraceae bacterium]|nr:hypothetical protein [Oscillospiraceae bacterium]
MKKRVLSIILAISVLSMTACGTNNEKTSNSSSDLKTSSDISVGNSSDTSSTDSSSSDESSEIIDEPDISYGEIIGPDGFVPDYSQTHYTDTGYYIGNHFVEYSNEIYNNNGIYTDYNRDYIFENNLVKLTDKPSVMWYAPQKTPTETYDIESAIACARANWNVGTMLCAPFVAMCMEAGGLSANSTSSTGLCLQLLSSGLGFGEFLPINEDQTVTLPDYARPGDVVQTFCPYEGLMLHSLLYVGDDEKGHMRVICRNMRNNGEYAFITDEECYDCYTDLKEVFLFHFYQESDDPSKFPEAVRNDSNVLLCRSNSWKLDEKYNREKAVEYAKNHIEDGIGVYGAQHLSACLTAGDISISFPNNTSLLFQLMSSGLGSAHSVNTNADRTVTLPKYAKEGDVMFFWCQKEGAILGAYMIKGKDKNGRMVLYAEDMVNDETKAFRVDKECLGCDDEPDRVILYCFDDGE